MVLLKTNIKLIESISVKLIFDYFFIIYLLNFYILNKAIIINNKFKHNSIITIK